MPVAELDLASFLDEFRAEAAEHLRALDVQLLNLERNPSDLGPIREMFLSAHTIKGAAALLQLGDTRSLAHAMEDVLAHLRDSATAVPPATIELLFRTIDRLRWQVEHSTPSGAPSDETTRALVAALQEQVQIMAREHSEEQLMPPPAPSALVVEDSSTVRQLEIMLLNEAGYQVDAVADGNLALDMALAKPYHLVVTAVETRGLKGLDLAAALRAQPLYRSLPIILLSSDENAEHRRLAAEIGVHAYIRKGALGDQRLLNAARELLLGQDMPLPGHDISEMQVLIADDDAIARRVFEQAVRADGHQVAVAGDGLAAWELFQTKQFDVIISDWMMPGMDGIELCSRVREHSTADWYTYFIFATSLGDKQHFVAAMNTGADDYLTKPCDRVDVQARLAAAQRVTSLYRQTVRDRAELTRLNHELFEQSRVDPLTQLGNRLRLAEDLEILDGRVRRYGHTYAVALFDVDYFKLYNDRYGHPAGDHALRAIATAARERCRQGDAVYRYGGEEFLVLLPEQSLESATLAMEDLRRRVGQLALSHEAKTPPGVVTISVGVAAVAPDRVDTAAAVLKRADEALYRSKQLGRNRVSARSDSA